MAATAFLIDETFTQVEGAKASGVATYQVETDGTENASTVCGYVPWSIGDELAVDSGCWVISINGKLTEDDKRTYTVTVTFGQPSKQEEPEDAPWDQPAKYEYGTNKSTINIIKDIDGNLIRNSAKQPFAEPIEIDHSRTTYTITKAYEASSFDSSIVDAYKDKVNNATWKGRPAKCWKVSDIKASTEYDKKWGYVTTVNYEFESAPQGLTFEKVLLDQGLQELKSSKWVPIKKGGQNITEPVPLNGSGLQVSNPSSYTPTFLTFNVYYSADFSIFNIT